ncbi:MAG: hypothetical protein ACTSV2_12865 [Candidatus Thorarchaeota archaeon]
MQYILDATFLFSIFAGLISVIGGFYLYILWRKQRVRLVTDLPLLFGATFAALGLNFIIMGLMNIGIIPDTLEVLRLRTLFVISAAVIPLVITLIHIWLSRFKKYYTHMIIAFATYWTITTIFSPTEQILMLLLVPAMILPIIAIAVTFTITWKTGRLKEVKSEMLVVSAILIGLSQVGKLVLVSIGLEFIADILSALGTIMGTVGLANPWYRRSIVQKAKPSSDNLAHETAPSV